MLTGEGADELFAGYDVFREDKVRRFWARVPDSEVRPLLFARLNTFVARDLARSGAFLAGFYGRGLTEVDDPLYSHRIRFANTARCLRLLRPELLEHGLREDDFTARLLARLPERYESFSALGKAQYLEITTFLEGYLLHSQGDRMLMGHSIEGRFPFLDYRVAELAARLPDRMRLRGLEEKHVLRLGDGAAAATGGVLAHEAAVPRTDRSGVHRPRGARVRARASRPGSTGGRGRLLTRRGRPRGREVRGGRLGPGGRDGRDGAGGCRLDDAPS